MPFQNRVQPTGEIIFHPSRGQFMGNRGILHDENQQLGKSLWRHKAWVTCVLEFKNRHRQIMSPRRYTELFFLDEAVAFAAGHRPCAECRRADYNRFRSFADIQTKIADFDAKLHANRAIARRFGQHRYHTKIDDLPDGTFILDDQGLPHRIQQDMLLPYRISGYGPACTRPKGGVVTVLTPALMVEVLRAGYSLTLAEPG
ncbi:MAG: hypothetical protein ABJL72_20205 [Roseobacter sp.]